MNLSRSLKLPPARYNRESMASWTPDATVTGPGADWFIEITQDGVELDLSGSILDGEAIAKWGVYVHDCRDVTVKDGTLKGFYYGIKADNVTGLTIENCVVADNHNPSGVGWLPDTDAPYEPGFGGGVYLSHVSGGLITGNNLSNNFTGLYLVKCHENRVERNDASFNGNVGIHLLGSTQNAVEGNRADHCIRYTGRFWCDTADSAGILLEEYSHHNRIVGNTFRYSGDGFFIRANNGHSSDHNYVARNDGSFSPNNAFEACFSKHNLFEDNVAEFSNYGFWLGYSKETTLKGNRICSNRLDGVAIESGARNSITGNEITANRCGIRLWLRENVKSRESTEACGGDEIVDNRIAESRECGILLGEMGDPHLEGNTFEGNAEDLRKGVLNS